ncbi:hypothetical protein ACIPJK_38540 [Streptomyces roseus]|uniref:hypothetical protein n=1 Tax=Streptomyces roseus TaxID=66430 RepID=UPI0037FB7193
MVLNGSGIGQALVELFHLMRGWYLPLAAHEDNEVVRQMVRKGLISARFAACVLFTCEGPEYWEILTQTNPNRVVDLYRTFINPDVRTTASGRPVRTLLPAAAASSRKVYLVSEAGQISPVAIGERDMRLRAWSALGVGGEPSFGTPASGLLFDPSDFGRLDDLGDRAFLGGGPEGARGAVQ